MTITESAHWDRNETSWMQCHALVPKRADSTIWWSSVSNAALRSNSTSWETWQSLTAQTTSLCLISVEWKGRYADCWTGNRVYILRWPVKHLATRHSTILKTNDKLEIGLYELAVSGSMWTFWDAVWLEPVLAGLGKVPCWNERLHRWDKIGEIVADMHSSSHVWIRLSELHLAGSDDSSLIISDKVVGLIWLLECYWQNINQ